MSFHEGALLYIYEQEDPEWWLALFDKEVGLVPANYVEVGEVKKTEVLEVLAGGREGRECLAGQPESQMDLGLVFIFV